MALKVDPVLLIISPIHQLKNINLEFGFDLIILISKDSEDNNIIYNLIQHHEANFVQLAITKYKISDLVVIAKQDKFDPHILKKDLLQMYENNTHPPLALLIPYRQVPVYSYREDGAVCSFIASLSIIDFKFEPNTFRRLDKLCYSIAYSYLNSASSKNIEIIQVGKPMQKDIEINENIAKLAKSLIVIPQKGSLNLLNRCLTHLNRIKYIPAFINLCFDDQGFKRFKKDAYCNLLSLLNIYKNTPTNVGPYLSRHYSIINTENEYIFFQDADDVSLESRFLKQINELTSRNLDMIGSHELRIDQIKKKILIFRFPLDANKSLDANQFHPLFHPTALITKKAYMLSGGFSTDRRFGYDSQFLLRAHFKMKIGNIDDFLYIRFKRPNSLTTHPKTKIEGNLRSFLIWRWNVDFRLVNENKLDLKDSSLAIQKHRFKYNFIKI